MQGAKDPPTEGTGSPASSSGAEQKPADGQPESEIRQVTRNLSALGLAGIALALWLLFHTEWLPFALSLLGLSGVFTVLASLSKLLTEERQKQLQELFDARVLRNPKTRWTVVVAMLGLIGPLAWVGSVRIRSLETGEARTVYLRPLAKADVTGRGIVLPAGETRTHPRWTLPWGRSFEVEVEGLPAHVVRVWPFIRRTVNVPDHLLSRPRLLLRPEPAVAANARRRPGYYTLRVEIDGETVEENVSYGGESIWVGCSEKVEIPDKIQQQWKQELEKELEKKQASSRLLEYLLSPLAIAPDRLLEEGASITVEVVKPDGLYAEAKETIAPRQDPRSPLQVAVLRRP